MAGKSLHQKRMGAGIYVKFPVEIDRWLREIADDDVRPISSVIRKIVIQYYEAHAVEPQRPKARRAVG